MVWSGGTYYLFYSGGHWTQDHIRRGLHHLCRTDRRLWHTEHPRDPLGHDRRPLRTGRRLAVHHRHRHLAHGLPRLEHQLHHIGSSCNGFRDLYVRPVAGLFSTSLPSISSFTASASTLPSTGGTVTLTAHATRAVSYTFLSSPGPSGIPAFVNTTSGTASTTAHIPANTSSSPAHYTFAVYATGPYGGQVSRGLGVTEKPQPPVISSFSPTTSTLSTSGGDVHFSIGASGATSYSISSSPSIPGLPTSSTTADLPVNTSGANIRYVFTLTATNSGGSSTRTTSVTVSSAQVAYASPSQGNTVVVRNLQSSGGWSETDLGGDTVASGTEPRAINAQGTEEIWFNDASYGDTAAVWYFNQTTRSWTLVHLGGDALAAGSSPSPIIAQGTEEVWFNDATAGGQAAAWFLQSSGGWTLIHLGGDRAGRRVEPIADHRPGHRGGLVQRRHRGRSGGYLVPAVVGRVDTHPSRRRRAGRRVEPIADHRPGHRGGLVQRRHGGRSDRHLVPASRREGGRSSISVVTGWRRRRAHRRSSPRAPRRSGSTTPPREVRWLPGSCSRREGGHSSISVATRWPPGRARRRSSPRAPRRSGSTTPPRAMKRPPGSCSRREGRTLTHLGAVWSAPPARQVRSTELCRAPAARVPRRRGAQGHRLFDVLDALGMEIEVVHRYRRSAPAGAM